MKKRNEKRLFVSQDYPFIQHPYDILGGCVVLQLGICAYVSRVLVYIAWLTAIEGQRKCRWTSGSAGVSVLSHINSLIDIITL